MQLRHVSKACPRVIVKITVPAFYVIDPFGGGAADRDGGRPAIGELCHVGAVRGAPVIYPDGEACGDMRVELGLGQGRLEGYRHRFPGCRRQGVRIRPLEAVLGGAELQGDGTEGVTYHIEGGFHSGTRCRVQVDPVGERAVPVARLGGRDVDGQIGTAVHGAAEITPDGAPSGGRPADLLAVLEEVEGDGLRLVVRIPEVEIAQVGGRGAVHRRELARIGLPVTGPAARVEVRDHRIRLRSYYLGGPDGPPLIGPGAHVEGDVELREEPLHRHREDGVPLVEGHGDRPRHRHVVLPVLEVHQVRRGRAGVGERQEIVPGVGREARRPQVYLPPDVLHGVHHGHHLDGDPHGEHPVEGPRIGVDRHRAAVHHAGLACGVTRRPEGEEVGFREVLHVHRHLRLGPGGLREAHADAGRPDGLPGRGGDVDVCLSLPAAGQDGQGEKAYE